MPGYKGKSSKGGGHSYRKSTKKLTGHPAADVTEQLNDMDDTLAKAITSAGKHGTSEWKWDAKDTQRLRDIVRNIKVAADLLMQDLDVPDHEAPDPFTLHNVPDDLMLLYYRQTDDAPLKDIKAFNDALRAYAISKDPKKAAWFAAADLYIEQNQYDDLEVTLTPNRKGFDIACW